jgi:hypothetical protein
VAFFVVEIDRKFGFFVRLVQLWAKHTDFRALVIIPFDKIYSYGIEEDTAYEETQEQGGSGDAKEIQD